MSIQEEAGNLEPYEAEAELADEARSIQHWIRILLLVLTLPWIAVFSIAIGLDPYLADGEARRLGTHRQIRLPGMQEGLPECNFKAMAGLPCPSCGMTTSFTLLMHADVWNSLQANFAGTLLATFGLLFVPWAFASAFFGRFVLIRRIEIVVFRLAIVFLVILFGRWAFVLLWELMSK